MSWIRTISPRTRRHTNKKNKYISYIITESYNITMKCVTCCRSDNTQFGYHIDSNQFLPFLRVYRNTSEVSFLPNKDYLPSQNLQWKTFKGEGGVNNCN